MLYQLRAMNSSGGTMPAEMVDGKKSVAELIAENKYATLLNTGVNLYALNGRTLHEDQLHIPMEEIGFMNQDTLNVLAAVKPANGALK